MNEHGYHRPVLLQESVDGLNIKPNGVYVDATFGGGGHSREILTRLDKGKLIGFDQDPDAKANVPEDPRFKLVDQNFRRMANWLGFLGIQKVDGILADLGVSSHQFDSSERGFSIRFDGPLDMRMDLSKTKTAAEVVNNYSQEELSRILRYYGEVQQPMKIAGSLLKWRPMETTQELKKAVLPFAPRMKEHKFFAQVFQALRIEVNEELDALNEFLLQTAGLLAPGGRLVIISYHSLEDRMVKDFMRSGNMEGVQQKDFFGNLIRPFKPLSAKPIAPEENEIAHNPRARSARMRIAERISD